MGGPRHLNPKVSKPIQYEWVYDVFKDYDAAAKFLNSLNPWQSEQLHIVEGIAIVIYYRVRT